MKRRLCSYDMVEVPPQAFVLTDPCGETYFCSLRCLCVWSIQLATRPNLPDLQRSGGYVLKTLFEKLGIAWGARFGDHSFETELGLSSWGCRR